ncbi:MAG: hypothetical protein KGL39_49875 [Patescibacteria group bacterium]|nr:hypothetical protein [Patescibacteria group bacterium]
MKFPPSTIFYLLSCALLLTGCGPSAKQLADQQARTDFRNAIAAMKVCTEGSTYAEFREKRMALETCYAANQSILQVDTSELFKAVDATDKIWNFSIKFPNLTVDYDSSSAAPELINMAINATKKGFQVPTPTSTTLSYVQLGLTLISIQCDDLLSLGSPGR